MRNEEHGVGYKCRRCGFTTCYGSYNKQLLVEYFTALFAGHTPNPNGWVPPTMLRTHNCDDGGLGVADFTGTTPVRRASYVGPCGGGGS